MGNIQSRSELIDLCGSSVYVWLLTNKPSLLDKHLPSKFTRWTYEMCASHSAKFKSLSEWKTNGPKSYDAAIRHGWLSSLKKTKISKLRKFTKEQIIKSAAKYKTQAEWKKHTYPGILTYSAKHGWLKEATAHMQNHLKHFKKVKNLNTGRVYNSLKDASNKTKINKGNLALAARSYGIRTAGGYRWAYCDENGQIIRPK